MNSKSIAIDFPVICVDGSAGVLDSYTSAKSTIRYGYHWTVPGYPPGNKMTCKLTRKVQ